MLKTLHYLPLFAIALYASPSQAEPTLRNDAYQIDVQKDGSLAITPAGGKDATLFRPEFTAVISEKNLTSASIKWQEPIYNLYGWKAEGSEEVIDDIFKLGTSVSLKNPKVEATADAVKWSFSNEQLSVEAVATLPPGGAQPQLKYTITAAKPAIYSVAYTGAPAIPLADVKELWQPLVWDGRRLPPKSFLVTDDHCSIPGPLVESKTGTIGVLADPNQFPYEMPNMLQRRFGVTVRNAKGEVQPLLFAPYPGAKDSKLSAGGTYSFTLDLVVQPTPLNATFEYIARNVCDFRDRRENTLVSLNESLDNIIEFTMSPAGSFVPESRSFNYPDAKGTVKNVSALHPLTLGIVRDDENLFRKQGIPILEYVMSRQKLLFAVTDEGMKSGQIPTARMEGPCVSISELAALQQISGGASPIFLAQAQRLGKEDRKLNMDWVSKGNSWQNDIWMYRATHDKSYLDSAKKKADAYIAARIAEHPVDFSEAGTGTFFDYMVPWWKDLYELYLDTKDPKYLEAAHKGARRYAQFVWFYPVVPDGDITVNKDGFAPRRGSEKPGLVPSKEETVPAWRVSEQGLICEGNGTVAHLNILLASHAPYFLRIAQETNDPFLRDIGRSAVIGRYAGFPGYHTNTRYSTAQEKADFPYHPYEELKVTTSFHFNHTLPMANMVMDYLMSEAYDRSAGGIDFPSEYAECYAYMGSQVYGAPGKFYDVSGVTPWMPKGVIKADNVQVNYVTGRKGDNTYAALINASDRALEDVIITFNPEDFADGGKGTFQARVWRDNKSQTESLEVKDGKVKVNLSPKGITVLEIKGLAPKVAFQDKVQPGPVNPKAVTFQRLKAPFGDVEAMVLSFGPDITWLYAYVTGENDVVKSAKLTVKDGNKIETLSDGSFPFEFTMPLAAKTAKLDVSVEAVTKDGKTEKSETGTLVLKP